MENYFEMEQARLDRMKRILRRIQLRTETIENLRKYIRSANGFDGQKTKAMQQIQFAKMMGELLTEEYTNHFRFLE